MGHGNRSQWPATYRVCSPLLQSFIPLDSQDGIYFFAFNDAFMRSMTSSAL
jgi:hypothetical protein